MSSCGKKCGHMNQSFAATFVIEMMGAGLRYSCIHLILLVHLLCHLIVLHVCQATFCLLCINEAIFELVLLLLHPLCRLLCFLACPLHAEGHHLLFNLYKSSCSRLGPITRVPNLKSPASSVPLAKGTHSWAAMSDCHKL